MLEAVVESRRASSLEAAAHRAIGRASDAAWSTQRPDGSWVFPADCGPSSTAHAIIALATCDMLEPAVGRELARGLRGEQLPDGSFVRFALSTTGDPATTSIAAAALALVGGDEERAAASQAWAFVERHGGIPAIAEGLGRGDLALAFLVAARSASATLLRKPGVELFAVPGLSTALVRRMHAGVLTVIGQLALLATDRSVLSSSRCHVLARAFAFGAQFQNDEGSFNTFTMPTALAACAYAVYGTPEAVRRARLAAGWIARRVTPAATRPGAWVPEFMLPTWSTVYHLRALLHAGASVDDPRVDRALAWLLATQHTKPQAQLNQPDRRATRVGGWAFDPENHTLPDCDDTGSVLAVLAMARDALAPSHPRRAAIEAAASRAMAWLGAMQNVDGGWAAYVKGLPGKAPGPMRCDPVGLSSRPTDLVRLVMSPPLALGDPSTEDVTARVLHGLGRFGATTRRSDIRRAVAFLRRQQCADGSFWGRWLMNHLAGSSYALQAAHAIGEPLDAPWVARTAAWILECQNSDGSWGETPASYRDPSLAGRGHGMAPLTGLVVSGLCAIGLARHPAVARAVVYLLDRQRPSGDWPDDGYIVPYLPPDTFYAHPETGLYYPLEALARFCRSTSA